MTGDAAELAEVGVKGIPRADLDGPGEGTGQDHLPGLEAHAEMAERVIQEIA